MQKAYSKKVFEEKLRSMENMYHIHHPYQKKMNSGNFSKEEMRAWVANRFYYQCMIPIKDAAILSKNPPIEHRRLWIQRIKTHQKKKRCFRCLDKIRYCGRFKRRRYDFT